MLLSVHAIWGSASVRAHRPRITHEQVAVSSWTCSSLHRVVVSELTLWVSQRTSQFVNQFGTTTMSRGPSRDVR
ncbi:MAG: hypothetical protein QOG79_6745 [Mycobacterium sp.]|jgi:hypothetical protein|nr:hypothetical protein [Mycobacterium sp.]